MDAQKYVEELSGIIVNPYGNSVNGSLMAPNSTSDAMVYVSEGAGTITLQSTTSTVVAVYDAEATFRSGQSKIYVYERNPSDVVIKQSLINVGRVSTDFLAGALISSSLKCTNTSATDQIAGNQSQATLHSIPKSVASLTATSLMLNVRDKDSKLVPNVNSKFDGTQSTTICEHLGGAMAFLRDGAKTNLARMGFNLSAAASTASDGIRDNSALDVVKSADFTTGQTYLDYATHALYDSKQSGNTKDPLTFASFKAHLTLNMSVANSGSKGDVVFKLVALDEAGTLLDSVDIEFADVAATGTETSIVFTQSVVSTTSPIARVMVFIEEDPAGTAHDSPSVLTRAQGASGRLEAVEETGDIPGRGIHVCVFEGVNGSASLNFHGANVIAGIPDSTTAFIAGGASLDAPDYDLSTVLDMLQSLKFNIQRAYTVSGATLSGTAVRGIVASPAMFPAMEARSFRKIGRAFRKARKLAQRTRDQLSDAAREVQPVIREAGQILGSMEGGEVYSERLGQADRAISEAQGRGYLKASYGSM